MKKIFCLLLVATVFCAFPQASDAKKKIKIDENKAPVENKNEVEIKKDKVIQPAKAEDRRTIAGSAIASKEQAVNFIKSINPGAKLNCSIEEIVELYYKEAELEGIRADIALCQALLETGYFRYGGDVKPHQNNFCGLGSVGGGEKGATFKTPEIGVRAHIQHLLVYSSKRAPKTAIVDPRYDMVTKRPDIFGVCLTWYDLNGRWAARGVPYGERILAIHDRLLLTEPVNSPVKHEEPVIVEKSEPEQNESSKSSKGQKMRERVKKILAEKVKQEKN